MVALFLKNEYEQFPCRVITRNHQYYTLDNELLYLMWLYLKQDQYYTFVLVSDEDSKIEFHNRYKSNINYYFPHELNQLNIDVSTMDLILAFDKRLELNKLPSILASTENVNSNYTYEQIHLRLDPEQADVFKMVNKLQQSLEKKDQKIKFLDHKVASLEEYIQKISENYEQIKENENENEKEKEKEYDNSGKGVNDEEIRDKEKLNQRKKILEPKIDDEMIHKYYDLEKQMKNSQNLYNLKIKELDIWKSNYKTLNEEIKSLKSNLKRHSNQKNTTELETKIKDNSKYVSRNIDKNTCVAPKQPKNSKNKSLWDSFDENDWNDEFYFVQRKVKTVIQRNYFSSNNLLDLTENEFDQISKIWNEQRVSQEIGLIMEEQKSTIMYQNEIIEQLHNKLNRISIDRQYETLNIVIRKFSTSEKYKYQISELKSKINVSDERNDPKLNGNHQHSENKQELENSKNYETPKNSNKIHLNLNNIKGVSTNFNNIINYSSQGNMTSRSRNFSEINDFDVKNDMSVLDLKNRIMFYRRLLARAQKQELTESMIDTSTSVVNHSQIDKHELHKTAQIENRKEIPDFNADGNSCLNDKKKETEKFV